MKEEKRSSIRRIALKTPFHARNLICRVIAKIVDEGSEVENAGRIASLLTVWKGLYELEQLSDMEHRLQEVESRQGIGQRIDLSKVKR
jgi:hypothetical protein